ncbi:MAG: helix-turn-helix domain-containing protein [bacterium]|nr:helix-turn-helix domain-containing protein [bacterium]
MIAYRKRIKEFKTIAERLRQVRVTHKLNRQQMATRLGIRWNSYYKYETGVNFPGLSMLYKLHKEFAITMDWILLGKGPMTEVEKELESRERDIAVKKKRDVFEKELAEMTEVFSGEQFRQLVQKPEFRELVAAMANSPQLYYELLAGYQKFKNT